MFLEHFRSKDEAVDSVLDVPERTDSENRCGKVERENTGTLSVDFGNAAVSTSNERIGRSMCYHQIPDKPLGNSREREIRRHNDRILAGQDITRAVRANPFRSSCRPDQILEHAGAILRWRFYFHDIAEA